MNGSDLTYFLVCMLEGVSSVAKRCICFFH